MKNNRRVSLKQPGSFRQRPRWQNTYIHTELLYGRDVTSNGNRVTQT